MEYLFSYGTLQQKSVQQDTFDRELKGTSDCLIGWVISSIQITDQAVIRTSGTDIHPILKATGKTEDIVKGTVFEISLAELDLTDAYEVEDYQRTQATLQSGKKAWIYVAANH